MKFSFADIKSLGKQRWLTGNVINMYIQYLVAGVRPGPSRSLVYIGSTFSTYLHRPSDFADILGCQSALFPANVRNVHWVSVIVEGIKLFREGQTASVSFVFESSYFE